MHQAGAPVRGDTTLSRSYYFTIASSTSWYETDLKELNASY